ncbi:ATPase [Paenibacillus sp. GSMTC-2017]|uniref:BadF/BadG/BcrA/BcrD ATPase family protein n=1 Tax=Paenibacillus sp. GSMTC-2017 TaxID=2794350 RepID=UPI0018D7F286|nr:BadF/BadG/BcrA/BcrD ATPase family protein [Paenibacillus sp. GSMTC-2017]MBH5319747.1 ATPase [Paenibacillus sp. GSMTC-2017]
MMNSSVVIGIDGGGTHTRVMVCDLEGNELAYVEGKGAASIIKDKHAVHNVQTAIADALSSANRTTSDVCHLVAGIAGFDTPEALSWVTELTKLPGLDCSKTHVNDAVSAHAGALLAKPGIIVISGTGSIIVGFTESGRKISNYDFHHYALSAARSIAYETVYEILAGNWDASDEPLIKQMLLHFEVDSLHTMAELAFEGFNSDKRARNKTFGQFAPYVTVAAENGSSVAQLICKRAAEQLKTGIEVMGTAFSSEKVDIAFIGGVISSPYMTGLLGDLLQNGKNRRYVVKSPELPPVVGSVLLALKAIGAPSPEGAILKRLSYS